MSQTHPTTNQPSNFSCMNEAAARDRKELTAERLQLADAERRMTEQLQATRVTTEPGEGYGRERSQIDSKLPCCITSEEGGRYAMFVRRCIR